MDGAGDQGTVRPNACAGIVNLAGHNVTYQGCMISLNARLELERKPKLVVNPKFCNFRW